MRYKLNGIIYIMILNIMLFSNNNVAQDIEWESTYGGNQDEMIFDILPTLDYGYILAGSSLSGKSGNKEQENIGDLDYCIWKIKENGSQEWQLSFGGTGTDLLQSINHTIDGGFILGGTSNSQKSHNKSENSKGEEDVWIIKLDHKGKELWQTTIGGNFQEKITSCFQTPDKGYLIAGSSASTFFEKETTKNFGSLDYWVTKLDSKGKIEWQKSYGGQYVDLLKVAVVLSDGYLLGGSSNSGITGNKTAENYGGFDYWIIKVDHNGEVLWQKSYGGNEDDILTTIIKTTDTNLMLAGQSTSGSSASKTIANGDGTDFWLLKINQEGNDLWQKTYDFSNNDRLESVIENEDGSLVLGGTIAGKLIKKAKNKYALDENTSKYLACKLSPTGEKLWEKEVGSKSKDILRKAIVTRDGSYLLAGFSNGKATNGKNRDDFWLVKLKDKDKPEKEPDFIESIPNPAIDFTNVIINKEYSEGNVSLYDINGRELKKTKVSGERSVRIDLSGLPIGIYVIDVDTNNGQEGIKVIKN